MNQMDTLLEKTKIQAFLYKEAVLLGTIMSKMNFKWDTTIPTACCSPTEMRWNPNWFKNLPERTRVTILLHELWHVARLHPIRKGNRDPKIWNMACDYRINNDLLADAYSFAGAEDGLFNSDWDSPRLSEEEIYNKLMENPPKENGDSQGVGEDLVYTGEEENLAGVQIVQSSTEYAKMAGSHSNSEVEEVLMKQLKPKVPWRRLLRQYFLDTIKEDYSWKRPNRRYEDVYLPSMIDGENLTTLNYYIDTSGSISTNQLIRFNAELKSICEDIRPKRINVINYDTEIRSEAFITPDQSFKTFKFTGRGGTDIVPVLSHIEKTKPIAAIIFSDLCCFLPASGPKVPIIWIIIDNPKRKPLFGKAIHISTEELT